MTRVGDNSPKKSTADTFRRRVSRKCFSKSADVGVSIGIVPSHESFSSSEVSNLYDKIERTKDLVRAGVVWCGVVWCGVVWCGVVWCGVVWCGVVWCGVVWCGVVWCGVVWCGEI